MSGRAFNFCLLPVEVFFSVSGVLTVRALRSRSEDLGVGPLGVAVREESMGGGSYATVVSENFSRATSVAMLAPERAPQ